MAASIEKDWRRALISAKQKGMLAYAEKLTTTPSQMKESDVQLLRDLEFSDLDILGIAEVVGYYAYVNRIADGLGVVLEDG